MHTECTHKYMYDIEKNTKFVIACNNPYKREIMKNIVIIISLSLFYVCRILRTRHKRQSSVCKKR